EVDGERPHQLLGGARVQALQHVGQLPPLRRPRVLTARADRLGQPAYPLDELEEALPLLLTQHLAQARAEEVDVGAKPLEAVRRPVSRSGLAPGGRVAHEPPSSTAESRG